VIGRYITVALQRAHYEFFDDGEGFYGSIPDLAGVWANAPTLEEWREGLKAALEDWLLFSLSRQHQIPVIGGVDLEIHDVA
jgi:predicted RNase H-like HicB family nuclease